MTGMTSSAKRKAEDDPDFEHPEATRTKLDENNITATSSTAATEGTADEVHVNFSKIRVINEN